jgi:hypothetical protein
MVPGRHLLRKVDDIAQSAVKNVAPSVAPKAALSSSIEPDLSVPAFKRRGVDVAGMQAADEAKRNSEKVNEMIIGPKKAGQLRAQTLADARAEDAAALDQIRREISEENAELTATEADKLARKALEGKLTPKEKGSASLLERMKKQKQLEAARARRGNKTPGDVASWHRLSDNYPVPKRPAPTLNELIRKGR